MKILAPVDSINEVEGLISAGADEFYGGFIPYNWFRKYGAEGSPNRRNFLSAQIKSDMELSQIIEKSHSSGKPFYLALNQKLFFEEQYAFIDNLMNYFKNISIDGLIIADPGLYLFLKKRGYGIPVVLSTLAQVMNSRSAEFFSEMGFKRIVLPRDLSLGEIKNIVKNNPSVEFEVLIFIGKCFNFEGFCTYEHSNPGRRWPCTQEYKITFDKNKNIENEAARQINMLKQTKRTDACGFCALNGLKKSGVKRLKIVGRGARFERKKLAVETLKFMLDNLKNKAYSEDKAFYALAKGKYKDIFGHNCMPANCYFPELSI